MNFDLDINNYEKTELEELFNLPQGYDITTLNTNESKLVDGIQTDKTITQIVKNKTIQFLENVKQLLMNSLNNSVVPSNHTTNINNISSSSYFDVIDPSFNANVLSTTSSLGYLSDHPSDYFPKPINPIVQSRSITLSIDTRFRDNYYTTISSDFLLTLPLRLTSVLSMSLGAIEFPGSCFYNISTIFQNNFFWLRAGSIQNDDVENQLIQLPDGNYDTTTALSLINAFLQTLTTTTYLQYIYFFVDITSNNVGTGQLIVYINSTYPYPNNPFPFTIDCQAAIDGQPDFYTPLPLKLGWALGFRNGIYINNSYYIAEGTIQFNGPFYTYLIVDDFNNSNDIIYVAFNSSIKSSNILSRMGFQNSNPLLTTNANVSSSGGTRTYPGPVTIEKLQIQLTDAYGRVLNLHNMDFSFSLNFTIGTNGPKS